MKYFIVMKPASQYTVPELRAKLFDIMDRQRAGSITIKQANEERRKIEKEMKEINAALKGKGRYGR